VDLSGFFLTDTNADKTQFQIPDGTVVPGNSFLLVWADGEPGQNDPGNPHLHANFNLRASGEAILLYDVDQALVHSVTFGQQSNNISEGFFPDGLGARHFMTTPTPGSPNTIGEGNTAPTLAAIADRTMYLGQTLSFTATATDAESPPQVLTFSLSSPPPGATIGASSGLFNWMPTSGQAPSTNNIVVRVDDNGSPPLNDTESLTVIVLLPPQVSINRNNGSVELSFPTVPGKHYQVHYTASLNPPISWSPLGDPVEATGSSLTISDNIGANPQRFYRIEAVD
jgi:hypothetical protein